MNRRIALKLLGLTLAFLVVWPGPAHADGPTYGWTWAAGGSSPDDSRGVGSDSAGCTYVAGFFQRTVDFDPGPGSAIHTSAGQEDVYLTKIDPDGNHVWTVTFGGSLMELCLGLHVTPSGTSYLTGVYRGTVDFDPTTGTDQHTSAGDTDIFVTAIKSDGSYLKTYTFGGSSEDYSYDVHVDGAGNIYVTGYFKGTADLDPTSGTDSRTSKGDADAFVTKVLANGTYAWSYAIQGPGRDQGLCVTTDTSSNVIVCGYFTGSADFDVGGSGDSRTSNGSHDIFLVKLTSSGSYSTALTAGGSGPDTAYEVVLDSSGNVYLSGHFAGSVDLDLTGLVGDTHTSNGGYDSFVTKLKADWSYGWTKSFGGSGNDVSYGVAVDSDGYVFVAGGFTYSVDFDPDPQETDSRTSAGKIDCFVSKFTSSGSYEWAATFGGSENDFVRFVSVNTFGSVLLTGNFRSSPMDFDPTEGTDSKTGSGHEDVYVCKLVGAAIVPVTTSIGCLGDTSIKRGRPNKNYGDEKTLRLKARLRNRLCLMFDQDDVEDSIGLRELVSARLYLYIESGASNWGRHGRNVGVHPMTTSWTELGATWNSPDDQDTSNRRLDGERWRMSGADPTKWPFASTPTDVVLHTNGLTGWVTWDVTEDVAAWLAGSADNHGWIVKKVKECRRGRVKYTSSEGTSNQPVLVIVAR